MALSDKNIVITPNTGQSADPKIVFSGADASTTAQNVTLQVYPTNGGTVSFEGTAGQLLSLNNSMVGTIYSVNDISGIPSIEVLDSGVVKLAQYGGNVLLGTGFDNGAKLQISGARQTTTPTLGSAIGAGLFVTNNDPRYGIMMGVSGNGPGWIQVGRSDGTATAYTLVLQPSGGSVNVVGALTVGGTNVALSGASAPASDVYPWAKAAAKPTYTSGEVGALASGGTAVAAATVTSASCSQNGDGWWRSSGGTGWYSTTYAVGIYSLGFGLVETYNSANFKSNGWIQAIGTINAGVSDARLKTSVVAIEDALAKVMAIRGVTFYYNDLARQHGYDDESQQVGVIAQEVRAVLPQVVVPAPFDLEFDEDGIYGSKTGENYSTVQYDHLTPLLIEAIKELNTKVNDQAALIQSLQEKLNGRL